MEIVQSKGGVFHPPIKQKPTREYGPLEFVDEERRKEATKHLRGLVWAVGGGVINLENPKTPETQRQAIYHLSDLLLGHHDYEVPC